MIRLFHTKIGFYRIYPSGFYVDPFLLINGYKTYPLILISMAILKLTIFKAKVLKDGRHKIRVAVYHKQETCYIIIRFIIDNLFQFKNGEVVKRSDAAMINTKLRNLLNK